MKSLVASALLILLLASPAMAQERAVTAEELAFHLGIQSWASRIRLAGNHATLTLHRVRQGRVAGQVGHANLFPTNREAARFSILASRSGARMQITIMSESGPSHRFLLSPPVASEKAFALPSPVQPGDYLLAGVLADPTAGSAIENIKEGLLLRISLREGKGTPEAAP